MRANASPRPATSTPVAPREGPAARTAGEPVVPRQETPAAEVRARRRPAGEAPGSREAAETAAPVQGQAAALARTTAVQTTLRGPTRPDLLHGFAESRANHLLAHSVLL